MSLALFLALQAAAAAPASAPPLVQLDFDLARFSPEGFAFPGGACSRGDPSAITVCGRRVAGAYPLAEMARIFEPGRLVAETRLAGNLIGDVHAESVPMDRGAVSNRAMVRVRLPF
jgi:hypothetical protein